MYKWNINIFIWTFVVYQVSQSLKPVCLVMVLKLLVFSREKNDAFYTATCYTCGIILPTHHEILVAIMDYNFLMR